MEQVVLPREVARSDRMPLRGKIALSSGGGGFLLPGKHQAGEGVTCIDPIWGDLVYGN